MTNDFDHEPDSETVAPEPKKTGNLMTWKPGQSGNPAGRPRGARSKLSEGFLDALQVDFEKNGPAVIETVRQKDPTAYLKVVANLMPAKLEAQLEAKIDVEHHFSDTNSIADILQLVAKEAGQEAAYQLASMFGMRDQMQMPDNVTLLPPIDVSATDDCPHLGTTYEAGGHRFPYRNCQCEQCREWRDSLS